jgi:hypothetical protein
MAILSFLLTACASTQVNQHSLNKEVIQLNKSQKVWNTYKNKYNNSYNYFTNFVSWVGFGNETKLSIKNGKVIKKEYTSWNKLEEKNWIEDKPSTLGKHKLGAKILLIDDLYKQCRNILLSTNKNTNHIYLSFDKKGLLHNCLYTPKNCADDCSNGIKIKEINFNK